MTEARSINPLLKMLLEVGPLAVFFLSFSFGERLLERPDVFALLEQVTGAEVLKTDAGPLMLATATFMVAIAVTLVASLWLTRTVPRMAAVTAVVVAVMGGLTLLLGDATFFKMKSTIVNSLFAMILAFGLVQGRSYLKYLMGEMMPLTDEGWMLFTRRWVWFFLFMAVLNEVVWRTQDNQTWVVFKTFVNLPITLVFVACQFPLLQKHSLEQN